MDDLPIVEREVVRLIVLDAEGRVLLHRIREPQYPEQGTCGVRIPKSLRFSVINIVNGRFRKVSQINAHEYSGRTGPHHEYSRMAA